MKILHLSDLHLRHYLRLNDLEELLETIEPHAPDLTLVTGDVADDLRLLPDSLSLISQLSPAMGTFGSLGNHEYFRGIKQVRRTFDASPIPLLVNEGLSLEYRGESIFIGGIDDPRHMGAKLPNFYRSSIDQTLVSESGQSLRLLLSHRPDALDYASVAGIDLTLAGHTHGGQIGFGGRSLLEPIWPDRYLWGHYQIGDSHLYTSSGVGHWLPFRLGCPAEAPIIELHRA